MSTAELTLELAARMIRDAAKDKSYQAFPIGLEVAQYLRYLKTQRDATDTTLRDYESCLAKLALDHLDLAISDFEPPVGVDRVEEFLYRHWTVKEDGEPTDPRTFSKNASILVSFFDWAVKKRKLYGNPARAIDRPRKRKKRVELFAPSLCDRVLNAQEYLADRVACRLILQYALRRGELARVQDRHFDFERKMLRVFGKGRKERDVPILSSVFWRELELLRVEAGFGPDSYLLYRLDSRKRRVPLDQAEEILKLKDGPAGYAQVQTRIHDRELAGHSVHRWWYRCLERAGIVEEGETRGENMHRGRHTAITGLLRSRRDDGSKRADLKMAQLFAGHADIRTTADTYDHRDVADLAEAMTGLYEDDEV